MSRISCPVLAAKVVAAEEAVAHIHDGDNVGFSGFTGAGYPKAVPAALAATMIRAHDEGRQFQVGLWTGASTAPEADGVLAAAHGIATRLPYNSDPTLRGMINAGDVRYIGAHTRQCDLPEAGKTSAARVEQYCPRVKRFRTQALHVCTSQRPAGRPI